MASNVVTGNVGDELLVAVLFDIEYERHLLCLRLPTKTPASEEETQFQRHIKPRQVIYGVEAYFRYVVNTKLALFNDALDLRKPAFARIVGLASASCNETQIEDSKRDRIENGLVTRVEGTVDKDVVTIKYLRHAEDSGRRPDVQELFCPLPSQFSSNVCQADPEPSAIRV